MKEITYKIKEYISFLLFRLSEKLRGTNAYCIGEEVYNNLKEYEEKYIEEHNKNVDAEYAQKALLERIDFLNRKFDALLQHYKDKDNGYY